MPEVTIRDVAREAGLSVSSVSRILRGGQGHVYPTSTHDRVREIADRLGYQANAAARLLRQNTRTLIGMGTFLTEHPHLNRFVVATRTRLLEREYDPVILDCQQLASAGARPTFPPLNMLAGVIDMGLGLDLGFPEYYSGIKNQMPIVALQAVSTEAAAIVDTVHVDYEDSYRQAIEHLLGLGHQQIAYLGPIDKYIPIDSRKYLGWQRAALQHQLNPDYVIPWGIRDKKSQANVNLSMTQNLVHQAVTAAVGQWRHMTPRPTAIICSSDEVAICLQSCLLANGVRLPDEISVVGYDGILFGTYAFPPLTTVAPDFEGMADAAISCLMERIASGNSGPRREILVKPHLVVRGSTSILKSKRSSS